MCKARHKLTAYFPRRNTWVDKNYTSQRGRPGRAVHQERAMGMGSCIFSIHLEGSMYLWKKNNSKDFYLIFVLISSPRQNRITWSGCRRLIFTSRDPNFICPKCGFVNFFPTLCQSKLLIIIELWDEHLLIRIKVDVWICHRHSRTEPSLSCGKDYKRQTFIICHNIIS